MSYLSHFFYPLFCPSSFSVNKVCLSFYACRYIPSSRMDSCRCTGNIKFFFPVSLSQVIKRSLNSSKVSTKLCNAHPFHVWFPNPCLPICFKRTNNSHHKLNKEDNADGRYLALNLPSPVSTSARRERESIPQSPDGAQVPCNVPQK